MGPSCAANHVLDDCVCLYIVRNSISGACHHFSRFSTSTPRRSLIPRPPSPLYLTGVPDTFAYNPRSTVDMSATAQKMSDEQKLKKKYEAAAARVARWEAWAVELRDGGDADVYLEYRGDLFREMVSACRATCRVPPIQRPPQLQAHSGASAIPSRTHTIIDFVAATHHAQAAGAEFSFNRYRKVIEFAVTKAEEELEKAQEEKEPGAGDRSVAKVRALASTTIRRCCSLQIQGKKGTKGGEEVDGDRRGGKPVGKSAGESKQPPEGSSKQQDREPPLPPKGPKEGDDKLAPKPPKGDKPPPKGPKVDKPPVKTPKNDKLPPKPPKGNKPPPKAPEDDKPPPKGPKGDKPPAGSAKGPKIDKDPGPKPPKRPNPTKPPGGRVSTLLEQDEMGKMTPSAHPKKGKGKQPAVAHSSEEESEAEEPRPKVRRSGPSGQLMEVVLTSAKGKGKKLPTRKVKAVKSAAVILTTDGRGARDRGGDPHCQRVRAAASHPPHSPEGRGRHCPTPSRAKAAAEGHRQEEEGGRALRDPPTRRRRRGQPVRQLRELWE